jgi:hypothetical protein
MKTGVGKGSQKIWFGLLKQAIRQGLPINEEFYRSWGTRDEISTLTFNRWWKLRGQALFESALPVVTLCEASDDAVTVRIPTTLNAVQVKQQVSALMTKHRGTKRLKKKPVFGFVGDVNYKRLKQYERYLEIEFDRRFAGRTIEEKTEALRDVYRRIKARLEKQKITMQKAGKAQVSKLFNFRDPDSFGSESQIRKGIDAKKVSRWRLSGKLLLLNVAEGEFPGRGYYGAQLAKKLRSRLDHIGLEDIGGSIRNKGGGRTKAQLTLTTLRRTKAQRQTESSKAYGKSKAGNPFWAKEIDEVR